MTYFIMLIAALVVLNFYFLVKRNKKGRGSGKDDADQREAAIKHHDDLVRTLDMEQDEAARRVDLRNRTLKMYEQVRKQAEEEESAAAAAENKKE